MYIFKPSRLKEQRRSDPAKTIQYRSLENKAQLFHEPTISKDNLIEDRAGIEMPYSPSEIGYSARDTTKEINLSERKDRGRVAIFIDGSNLFYAALELKLEIDYNKLLSYLVADSPLLRCFFYTAVDPKNEKQQGFLHWLRRHGYRVISKDIIQLPDGSKKGNLDVEIVVDMISLADFYDTAILVSGDGDLAYAVNALTYRGLRVEVVGLRCMTSESLLNVADRYIELDAIKEQIQKLPEPGYNYSQNASQFFEQIIAIEYTH